MIRLMLLGMLQVSRVEPAVDPARQVVILVNEDVPESAALGRYYARRRGIPPERILRVRTTDAEAIGWPEFREQILGPFRRHLGGCPDTLYCAVAWGIPVRLTEENPANDDPAGPSGDTHARAVANRDHGSVDRELELALREHPIEGWIPNPLFQRAERAGTADRLILVGRLDGPSAEEARGLVDRALEGEIFGVEGTHVLDTRGLKAGSYAELDAAMGRVQGVFEKAGVAITHEKTDRVVDLSAVKDPAHYWGWGAGSLEAQLPFRFRPGAVAVHLHPLSARDLRRPDRGWAGPLVAHGATAAFGTLYEPTDAGYPDGAVFFERFMAGEPFAASMAAATRFSSWVGVWIGDPVYAPYAPGARPGQAGRRARAASAPADLEAALDAGKAVELGDLEDLARALDPEHPLAFLVREARGRAGAPARGTVAQLREALRRGDPEQALKISPTNFEANLEKGRAAPPGKAAIRHLEAARAVDPASAEARMLLARAYLSARRLPEALAEAEGAFELSLGVPSQRLLADVLTANDRMTEALVHRRRVHRADPSRAETAIELAEACMKLEKPPEAIEALEAALGDLPADAAGARRLKRQIELLEKAAQDAKDEKRRKTYQELGRQWKASETQARDLEAVGKLVDGLASDPLRRELQPLKEYPEPVEGLPRLWIASRHIEPVELYVHGPGAHRAKFEPLRGTEPEKVGDRMVVPGIYRVVVVVGSGSNRKIFVRSQRLETGRAYALAINENDRLYLPTRPARR